ncbi:MAG: cysteine desulfurase [Lachnospiraceae bacterium]|nr:cysteine desulfurase [Lachnospiraceae bacterium]
METVYLDNGATTPICKDAVDAMNKVISEEYGNPSGVYTKGVEAKGIINRARTDIAASLKAFDNEIYFTSGGSESDNWALVGTALKAGKGHIISTAIEHHAVMNTLNTLGSLGYGISFAKPDSGGFVSADSVLSLIRPDTFLISMMLVNNETGVYQPVSEVGAAARKRGIIMHTDAVAAVGKVPVDVNSLNVDLLSASAHKFHGPKGTGFLYIRRGTPISPFIYGGGQEMGMRGGTENTPCVAGMNAALKYSESHFLDSVDKQKKLKQLLFDLIKEKIPDVRLNGYIDSDKTAPWCLNISIPGIVGTSLLILLDMKGICASTGATCNQSSKEPSHVLTAMGRSKEEAASSIRFTLSFENTEEEIRYTADVLAESVRYLRSMN